MQAQLVPWSSVTGQSIMVFGKSGVCIGTLSVRAQNTGAADFRTCTESLAETTVVRLNAYDGLLEALSEADMRLKVAEHLGILPNCLKPLIEEVGAALAKAEGSALIAAAPEMLGALKWARGCVPFPSDCHSAVVAAIAKAEGADND